MSKAEKAVNYFNGGFLCSQAVFAAYAEEIGVPEKLALKIAASFGSGMCKAEVCGACTGALMVIGSKFGQDETENKSQRARNNQLTAEFLDEFARRNGSYLCKDLLHCNISTPDGLAVARQNNLFTAFCPKMVASAVEVLEKVIETEQGI